MHTPWSTADIHIHTTASDGLASPREVLEWVCSRTDLSVIAITDHNTVAGALEAAEMASEYPVEVIVGQEVDSDDGHVIGLWAPERIPPGLSPAETVARIHSQGGIAIAAHPFAPRWWARHGLRRGDREVYDAVDFDAFEVSNSTPLLFHANWRARRYMAAHRERLAITGGSDAHILAAIGASLTMFPGTSAADLRRAIETRTTRARRPGFWASRNMRYLRSVREIMRIDRERKHARNGEDD
jgi:hypothetical protein